MLFYCGYTMHDGFEDVLKIPTDVLSLVRWPALFSLDPIQTLFDLVRSTFPATEELGQEKKQILWNLILNNDMKSLDKEDRGAKTTM